MPTSSTIDGIWRRIADAAEAMAQENYVTNETTLGYMLRVAKAFETIGPLAGGSGSGSPESYQTIIAKLVSGSGGDASNFLNAAGGWTKPVGTGSTSSGNSGGTVADTVAPVLSNPTVVASTTSATMTITTNEGSGTLYWFLSNSNGPPSALTIMAGTGAAVSGVQGVSAVGAQNIAIPSGLSSATQYWAYFVQKDDAGNVSDVNFGATFTTQTIPVAATDHWGAANPANFGGIPVGAGVTITSGNGAGHFTVTSDVLVGTPAGAAAGYNAGPYVFGFSDSSTKTIVVDANTLDVRTTAEALTLVLSNSTPYKGKRIRGRRDSYRGGASLSFGVDGTNTKLGNGDYQGLTFEGETPANDTSVFPAVRTTDPCTIDKFITTGGSNFTFRKLATTRVAEMKFRWRGGNGFNSRGITIDQCHISGAITDPYGDYSNSTNYPNTGVTLATNTGSASNTNIGSYTFTNNVIEHSEFLLTAGADLVNDANILITGNLCQYAYADCIHFTNGRGMAATNVVIMDNYCRACVGLFSDSGSPHGDAIQGQGSTASLYDMNITIERNYITDEGARGGMHGIFCASFVLSGSGTRKAYTGKVRYNLIIGDHNDAITIAQAGAGMEVSHNTAVQRDERLRDNQVSIKLGGTGDSYTVGTQVVTYNVADYINTTYLGIGSTVSNNVVLGQGGSTIPYATAFAGSGTAFQSPPADRPTALARFTAKAGGPVATASAGSVAYVSWPSTIPGSDGVAPITAGTHYTLDSSTAKLDSNTVTLDAS